MATTQNTYTGNGSTTNYSFTFPYLAQTDVKVKLDGVTQATTAYSFANATTISMNSAPGNGVAIIIFRDTNNDSKKATFYPGSAIKAEDLNNDFDQILYVAQEVDNNAVDALGSSTMQANLNIGGYKLINVSDPTAAQDAVTKAYLERTGSIQSAQIQDGTIVNADVNASAAIAGTKISPDFGSQNIATSGTVDGRDVSADGIKLDSIETGATADQNASEIRALVESASDSNVFTDADHSKLNAIEANATADQTAAEIRTLVESASDSNVFTDADHTKLNAIETGATADQTAGEIKTLLQSDKLTASEIANGTITATQIATGALDGRYYTESESDARYFNVSTGDTIKDGDTFPDNDTTIATTAAINDRIIDLVDDVGGFVPIANETSFPNANPDVNNGAGTLVSIKALSSNLTSNGSGVATIANGTVGNSTVTITGLANSTTYAATFGMIVETTSTLNTYTFHRQVPKATEVTTVAGNISNINSVAGNSSNINSAVSNASNINSAVSNASNINSVAGNISNVNTVAGNNTNINTVAGANSNISTVAGSISNVNTAAGSIANINTVATNINSVNDFSDVYRIASSAPTSHLHEGDLYFNTSSNELQVYNGSSWQGGVTATGNLASLGANTFTGNQSLGDDLKVQLGTGNDLQIYHSASGTQNVIKTMNGNLNIRYSGQEMIVAKPTDAVELYYDNSKKFETTANGIKIYDTSNNQVGECFDGGFNFTSLVWVDNLRLLDSEKIELGTSQDLQLYHDGSHSYITNTTGELIIRDDSRIRLRTDSFVLNSGDNTENLIYAEKNAAVELYYDGSKKLETTGNGVKAYGEIQGTGDLHLNNGTNSGKDVKFVAASNLFRIYDDVKLTCGTGDDLQIYHDGTDNYWETGAVTTHFRINSGNRLTLKSDGNVQMQGSSGKNFEWKTTGILSLADNAKASFGTGDDFQIYHNGTNNVISSGNGQIQLNKGASETLATFGLDGSVDLYYDNSKKLETIANGVQTNGSHFVMDGDGTNGNPKFACGNGADLNIYHDGSHSYIKDTGTGELRLASNQFTVQNAASNETLLYAVENGAVGLKYDDSLKFETTSTGSKVTGADLTVIGTEGISAGLYLIADEGDDNGDGWRLNSNQDDNDLTFANDTSGSYVDKLTLQNDGDLYTTGDIYLKDGKKLILGDDSDINIKHQSSHFEINNTHGNTYFQANGQFSLRCSTGGSTETYLFANPGGAVEINYDNSKKLETTASGVTVTGTCTATSNVFDSKGNVRDIIQNTQSSAYTLVGGDAGKHILISSGGVTVPANVFGAGNAVTIVNNSGSDQTITQGSGITMYNTADAATGNRTLAQRGMCTILFASGTAAYISGAGLS